MFLWAGPILNLVYTHMHDAIPFPVTVSGSSTDLRSLAETRRGKKGRTPRRGPPAGKRWGKQCSFQNTDTRMDVFLWLGMLSHVDRTLVHFRMCILMTANVNKGIYCVLYACLHCICSQMWWIIMKMLLASYLDIVNMELSIAGIHGAKERTILSWFTALSNIQQYI